MPTRTVATTETNKLRALRAAARTGFSALDRGKFKEFRSIEDLQAYLNDLSDKIVSNLRNGLTQTVGGVDGAF
jgi:hypothetical protein